MNLDAYRTTPAVSVCAPKIVVFDMAYRGTADVSLIQCVRSALDCGLVAAKDLVVTARGGSIANNIRVTEQQYERLVAFILMDPQVSLSDVSMTNVRIVSPEPPPKVFDFTQITVAGRPTFPAF